MGFLSTRLFLKNPPVFTHAFTDLLENSNLTVPAVPFSQNSESSPRWKTPSVGETGTQKSPLHLQNRGLGIGFLYKLNSFSKINNVRIDF